ncbi:MAG: TSCPD domain-containing protein [Bacteroidaceae bacterium]|nr:TSCPD domain-containing protein [Bacteroidaceae bacterium]
MFDVTLISDVTEAGLRHTTFQTCALVCSELIDIETSGDTIKSVRFTAGCNGNLQGIGAFVAGMKIQDAITRLEGRKENGELKYSVDQLCRENVQLKTEVQDLRKQITNA